MREEEECGHHKHQFVRLRSCKMRHRTSSFLKANLLKKYIYKSKVKIEI